MADRILIVEDNPVDSRILSTFLKQAGFDVVCTRDGSEGINLYSNQLPDLVVLDLGLPMEDTFAFQWDGIGLLSWMQKQPGPHAPVVVVTAQGPEIKEKVLKAGAKEYFQKPVKPVDFVARVKAIISESRLLNAGTGTQPTESTTTIRLRMKS